MYARKSGKSVLRKIMAVASVILIFVLIGCSGQSQLVPGPGTEVIPGNSTAVGATAEGVHMVVDAAGWTGNQAILQEITPLRVTIENNSGKPLLIRYRDFAITSTAGKYYAALPPYEIKGTVSTPYVATGYPTIASPDFEYNGFLIAPYYHSIYPGIPTTRDDEDFRHARQMRHDEMRNHEGGYRHGRGKGDEGDDFDFGNDDWLFWDPYYYGGYYTYWNTISLPTPGMLKRAIPEGVIKDGGRLSGFLYFEEVSPKLKMVNFRTDLVDAQDGSIFGTISIPFVVIKQ